MRGWRTWSEGGASDQAHQSDTGGGSAAATDAVRRVCGRCASTESGKWMTVYFNKAGNWVSSGIHPTRAAAREERTWAYKAHRDWEKKKAKKAHAP